MKKLKGLTLVLSGVVLGITISFSPQIYAATSSLLGSKVEKVIVVKLDKVELGNAIAVDGISYLPVRSLSNALDVGVEYTSDVINLTSGGGTTLSSVDNGTPLTSEQNAELARIQQEQSNATTGELNRISKEIRAHEKKIELAERAITLISSDHYKSVKDKLDYYESKLAEYPYVSVDIERYKADIEKMDSAAVTAKSDITASKAQIVILNEQLSALK